MKELTLEDIAVNLVLTKEGRCRIMQICPICKSPMREGNDNVWICPDCGHIENQPIELEEGVA